MKESFNHERQTYVYPPPLKFLRNLFLIAILFCLIFLGYNHLLDSSKPLYGEKITLIGDSITEHNFTARKNWAMYINDWTGANIQNLGISGTGFYSENHDNNTYIHIIKEIDKDTDLIGVAASFNNTSSLEVGDVSDTVSANTLCGYINEFFDKLQSEFPNTNIICYSQGMWGTHTPSDADACDYIDSIELICQKRNIPFIRNLFSEQSQLNPTIESVNKELYSHDNYFDYHFYTHLLQTDCCSCDVVHPNSKGHKIIAKSLLPYFLMQFQ